MTPWYTPADIDNLIREAGLITLRENRDTITFKDMYESYNRLSMGALTKEKYNKKSVTKTACHEAGHAILAYLAHPTAEVLAATIRPRGGALGFVQWLDIEHLAVNSPSKEHWMAVLQVGLAGYVAERLYLGTTASGVGGGPGSDFYQAMGIAKRMVWSLGMGKSGYIGDFEALRAPNGESYYVSEKTKELLDQDVQDILQECLKRTTEILTKHKDVLDYFTAQLLEKHEIYREEILEIFNKFGLEPASKSNEDEPFFK
jgi:cell division protease FtsH